MNLRDRHDCFIGRWRVFHDGHVAMIRRVWWAASRPVLILVMDTDEKPCAITRCQRIKKRMDEEGMRCTIITIPPIASVNWGRDVGYECRYIDVPDDIKQISATKILGEA
jgi:nicotinamide mononucleotide adenylyltransferase